MSLGTGIDYANSVDLFDRRYTLTVETTRYTDLEITFDIKRSLSAKVANSAEIVITNLSEASRKALHADTAVFVSLEAGYAGGTSLIYRGEIREAWSAREGVDWHTTISSTDGALKRKQKRIQRSFAAGASVRDVIIACAEALQINMGNVEKAAVTAALYNVQPQVFTTGYVASGDALSQLDRICRSCGLEWSVQDNTLQLLPRGKASTDIGLVLSGSSGLIDSPELGRGGLVKCKCKMLPGLYPGRRCELRSRYVQGLYRIETVHLRGDYRGSDWGGELELRAQNDATTTTTTNTTS